jgi:cholesterol transport system auxiliary component
MNMSMRNLIWFSLALSLSGCVSFGFSGDEGAAAIIYYVMEDGGRTVAETAPSTQTLLLADTTAGAFYDTDGMAFSSKAGTRGYYQYARWSERSSKRFSDLLLGRLERERIFAAVMQSGSSVRGDWLLMTDILDLHHDATERPGVVRMELRAELVDLKTRRLLARKSFVQTIPVGSYDAAGAHQAFSQAATMTLNEISDWLKELAGKS